MKMQSNTRTISLIFVALLATALTACAGTRAAYEAADTIEAKAFVASNHFNYVQVEAAEFAESGLASQTTINKMAKAEREARPVVLSVGRLARAWAADPTEENYAELQLALGEVAVLLAKFVNSIRGP